MGGEGVKKEIFFGDFEGSARILALRACTNCLESGGGGGGGGDIGVVTSSGEKSFSQIVIEPRNTLTD